jgi:hypothetical protein
MKAVNEIWRDIPGFEFRYQVSNLGRVKSLNRLCWNKNTPYPKEEYILKPSLNNKGYYSVNLWTGKNTLYRIHTLVAMTFLGYERCGVKQVIDHIDGDKLNNNLSNLQVTSQRVNSIKSIRNNKYSNYTGVTFDKARGKWVASISINGKKHRMGRFNCEAKAAYAYNQKLKESLNEGV